MRDRSADDWNALGETEPFFAVLTEDRFLRERMSDFDRDAFFATGFWLRRRARWQSEWIT
jgi:hypothetical protein